MTLKLLSTVHLYEKLAERRERFRKLVRLDAPDLVIGTERRMIADVLDALRDRGCEPRQAENDAKDRPTRRIEN